MAKSILTLGQRRLHVVVLVFGLYLVANAAYLFFFPPAERTLPHFYQWMLVSHVVLGIVLLVPMTWFVVWHLRRALAMHNPKAVWTGVLITAASFALFVTGLFLFSKANSVENEWAFISHRVLALAVPLGYVLHRYLSRNRPPAWAWKTGIVAPVALLGLMAGIHYATLPEPRPVPQSFVAKPAPGVDPFLPTFPDYGVSGAATTSAFFPAATRSITGGFLPKGLLTNNDISTAETLQREVKEQGFAVAARIGSETCARCHADIAEQWARSAHRYASFNNPFYRASVESFRKEPDGKQRSQWCAGCHDPAIMMAGNMVKDVDPLAPESQAGLTCLACHLMDEVHGVGGNGNYRINDGLPSPYLFDQAKGGVLAETRDLLIKSKPGVHKADMLKPVFRTSEYCGTCHKVSLDTPINHYRWIRGQNEYDNHQNSGVTHSNARTFYLPPSTKGCRDCHMPLTDAPLGDVSAKGGKVRSHLFMGPNTALPHIRGDQATVDEIETFLRDAKMRVDVFAVKQGGGVHEAPDVRPVPLVAGDDAEVQVVVRNLGVGHTYPGGTLDSNESWIHFTVADAAAPQKLLWESGALDPQTLRVDEDAHFYRVLFVDESGREANNRNPQDFRAAVHLKVIGPGTSDLARYALTVPSEWAGRKIVVTATLRWRKFTQHYLEFAWKNAMPGRPLPVLPITDLATGKATFDVVADAAAAANVPDVPADVIAKGGDGKAWMRWNDWGVGLILQGDTAGAQIAFSKLRDAAPGRVDGWRNLARVKLNDGNPSEALALMEKADACAPGDAQNAFFLGSALEGMGQLDAARGAGAWTFTEVTADAGLGTQRIYALGVACADTDGDGDTDVLVTGIDGYRFLRNDGGRFTDVAPADTGLDPGTWTDSEGGVHGPFATSAAFLDYDLDGRPDLFVCHYVHWSEATDIWSSMNGKDKSYAIPRQYQGESCRLWRNVGGNRFEDATDAAHVRNDEGKSLGVCVIDLDDDRYPDLVVANDTQPNYVYLNQRDGTFKECGVACGIAYGPDGVARAGMGVDAATMGDKSRITLAIGNFSGEPLGLWEHRGSVFVNRSDVTRAAEVTLPSLTFGVRWADVDLDGRQDVVLANGHIEPTIQEVHKDIPYRQSLQVLRQGADGRFADVTAALGDVATTARVHRSVASADVDGDGDLDWVFTVNGGPAVLVRQDLDGAARRSLRVHVVGKSPATDALGAKVTVTAAGLVPQVQWVRSGAGFLSESERTLTFGLGAAAPSAQVTVRWPDGHERTWDAVAPGLLRAE